MTESFSRALRRVRQGHGGLTGWLALFDTQKGEIAWWRRTGLGLDRIGLDSRRQDGVGSNDDDVDDIIKVKEKEKKHLD